ncbi:B- and T-lymphocyte attenuator-like isoform 1-T2 [Pangshura tecta]
MYEAQGALVTLFLLLFKLFQVVGDGTVNCTVEIQVQRGLQYESKPGDSLSIECPVKYCTEKPVINWCLIEGMWCLLVKDGPTRHTAWREGNVAVLNFMPIHQSDSGLYRCRATLASLSSESHVISIIVKETTDFIPVTHESQALPGNLAEHVGFSLLLHYLLTGGTISCVIIVTILYCTLQHRVRQLSRRVASASVLTKTGNNMTLNTMAAPDNPSVYASGMSGVSDDNQSDDIYEN